MIPGIVRGVCTANQDPQGERRITAAIPALGWANSKWMPACGTQTLPVPGEPVWIMFELGDENSPVWLGTAYAKVGAQASNPLGLAPADHPGDPTSASFIDVLKKQLGIPYVWGGTSPSAGFDCSGLVVYACNQIGVNTIPRTSEDQFSWAMPIVTAGYTASLATPISEIIPGTLVFMVGVGDHGSTTSPGHIGVSVGSSQMINAPYTGANVDIVDLTLDTGGGVCGFGFVPGMDYEQDVNGTLYYYDTNTPVNPSGKRFRSLAPPPSDSNSYGLQINNGEVSWNEITP